MPLVVYTSDQKQSWSRECIKYSVLGAHKNLILPNASYMDKGAQIWFRDRGRTFSPPLRLATLSLAYFLPLPFLNIIDIDIDIMSVIHLYSVFHFVLE